MADIRMVAIPTNGTRVDDHFGHCQFYTIFSLNEKNEVITRQLMPSPAGCGCKSDIASILKGMGVRTMIAGNIGEGAVNKLNSSGIEVLRGFTGETDDALKSWMEGYSGNDSLCSNHAQHDHTDGHKCNH